MTEPRQVLDDIFSAHAELLARVRAESAAAILAAGRALVEALGNGATVYTCGNGGSAADSQHFAAELVGRFVSKTRSPLPSVALTVDSSAMTAISNDFGYEQVFARQVEALGRPGDVLLGITTSGRSPNVLAAFETARRRGLTNIALVGADGSTAAPYCSHVITIPSPVTARVQEMHITVLHAWCDLIDRHFSAS